MTFSRLRTWLFFGNLFDYLIISTFSHTGMIIDGNVLVKMGIKPFFPIRHFLECLRLIVEEVNHSLSASLCGRVEGVERTTSRSRKWANLDIYHYDYFVAKDHIAIYLRRLTRERVTTILTGFRSARLWAIKGTGFQKGDIRDGQSCQSHATQHERCGINAKPSEKRARKGFKKIS